MRSPFCKPAAINARAALTLTRISEIEKPHERLTEARAEVDHWLEAHPDDLWVRWLQGRAMLAAGDRSGAHRAFQQAETGGGLLVDPDSTTALGTGLLELIRDPERRRELGRQGRQAVERDFGSRNMAQRTAAVYQRITDQERADP